MMEFCDTDCRYLSKESTLTIFLRDETNRSLVTGKPNPTDGRMAKIKKKDFGLKRK